MEFHDREFFVSQIMSNYIKLRLKNDEFRLYLPTNEIMYEANDLVRHERKNLDLMTDDEICQLLLDRGLWTEEKEYTLNTVIPDNMEKLKVGLYESAFRTNEQLKIKKYIDATNKEYEKLYNKRHRYDYYNLEGYLSFIKVQFLVYKTARQENKEVDWSKVDLNLLLNEYYKSILSIDVIRELSRTTPWVNMWPVFKANGRIFENPYITLEQQQLIQWSILYDNARESMECPYDQAFDDDDMFDGWLSIQKRKRESEQNKKKAESRISRNSKISNADEIFLVADTVEDAKAINSLNDPQANNIRKSRLRQIQTQGIVKESNLTDVKRRRLMERNKAYIQRTKGAK